MSGLKPGPNPKGNDKGKGYRVGLFTFPLIVSAACRRSGMGVVVVMVAVMRVSMIEAIRGQSGRWGISRAWVWSCSMR